MEGRKHLNFCGLIKESLCVLSKNPKFLVFSFLSSLPLFYSLVMYEIVFQETLIETGKILLHSSPDAAAFIYFETLVSAERLIKQVSLKCLFLGFLHLGIIHFLDLFNIVAIVDAASRIYRGGDAPTFKDMLSRPLKEIRPKGPLITSICVLLLASLVSLGLISLGALVYLTVSGIFITVPFVVLFASLFAKYMEWSAIWNMAIVMSILEEKKQGDVALVISSYLTRGNRPQGLLLELGFFTLRLSSRLSCLYVGWGNGGCGAGAITGYVGLVCLANVWRWVIFVVYLYDCKKNSEKTMDAEEVIRALEPVSEPQR